MFQTVNTCDRVFRISRPLMMVSPYRYGPSVHITRNQAELELRLTPPHVFMYTCRKSVSIHGNVCSPLTPLLLILLIYLTSSSQTAYLCLTLPISPCMQSLTCSHSLPIAVVFLSSVRNMPPSPTSHRMSSAQFISPLVFGPHSLSPHIVHT